MRTRSSALFDFFLTLLCLGPALSWSDEASDARKEATRLIAPLVQEGYEFRAEMWTAPVSATVGRAVRVQLFKGLDYRFCIATAPGKQAKIIATVLDFEGRPFGKASPTEDGHAVILSAKPKRTGLYVVALRQENGNKDVTCALVTGWK